MPAAPATQPSPNSGTRLTSGRRPRRAAILASSEGTARPVTVVEKMTPTSWLQSGGFEGAVKGLLGELEGDVDEDVVRRGEVGDVPVLLERDGQVPAADARVGVIGKRPHHDLVAPVAAQHVLGRTPR